MEEALLEVATEMEKWPSSGGRVCCGWGRVAQGAQEQVLEAVNVVLDQGRDAQPGDVLLEAQHTALID